MKALNYLEWYLDFWEMNNYNIKIINKVANFYNQKFTVDLLVNPHKVGETILDFKYKQSESLRLFDGWENDGSNEFRVKIGNKLYQLSINWLMKNPKATLNDFITLCNLAGIDLQWNESNEKVKEMFK